jgi:hypothetical protein
MKIGRKRKSRRERLAEHAAALAPPEEKAGHTQTPDAKAQAGGNGDHQHLDGKFHDGSIVLDAGKLHLPESLFEGTEKKKNMLFGIEPVVLVILAVALLFICFIAYLISVQPPK